MSILPVFVLTVSPSDGLFHHMWHCWHWRKDFVNLVQNHSTAGQAQSVRKQVKKDKSSWLLSHFSKKKWNEGFYFDITSYGDFPIAATCNITIAWIHHKSSGNQYSGLCHKLLWGRCSDIMNVLETRLHVKWMWEKNEVHLTSIYSPQLLKIAFALVLPLDIFLPITKSHKDPPGVLCVCATSALLS